MKKTKKLITMLLSLCLVVSALSVSAAAADYDDDSFYSVHVMSAEETAAFLASTPSLAIDKNGTALLTRTNASGTNGSVAYEFDTTCSEVKFAITYAPGATDYNVAIYAGKPGSGYLARVPELHVNINTGVTFLDLEIGQHYYILISSYSLTVPQCNANYTISY